MRRQNPLFTTFGFVSTVVLLSGLGLMLWRSGGSAFSPGNLSAKNRPGVLLEGYNSHASFEEECAWCHQPLQTTQDSLCVKCHTGIEKQINMSSGTHSLINKVNLCSECHLDHQGYDFNPTESAFEFFDHSATSFSLIWHQVDYDTTPMGCKDCHMIESGFSFSNAHCAICHARQDLAFITTHEQDFGDDCTSCHNGEDAMVRFDHRTTAFLLEGKHGTLECGDCHNLGSSSGFNGNNLKTFEAIFKTTSRDCIQCHDNSDIHPEMFSSDCETCHTPDGWLPAKYGGERFDHEIRTEFSLTLHQMDFNGEQLLCSDCHHVETLDINMHKCINCHETDNEMKIYLQNHQEQFGPECISCHDGVDRMNGFDHNNLFVLDGQHAIVECESCHLEKIFTGTPKECFLCHAEPEIHADSFGLQCQYCHTSQAWTPAFLQTHKFPLEHGSQVTTDCQVCHLDSYTTYTCYGCHDHQPGDIIDSHSEDEIPLDKLQLCTTCHPTGLKHESEPAT